AMWIALLLSCCNMMGASGLYLGGASRPDSCLQPCRLAYPFIRLHTCKSDPNVFTLPDRLLNLRAFADNEVLCFAGDDDNLLFTMRSSSTPGSWLGSHTEGVIAAMLSVWHGYRIRKSEPHLLLSHPNSRLKQRVNYFRQKMERKKGDLMMFKCKLASCTKNAFRKINVSEFCESDLGMAVISQVDELLSKGINVTVYNEKTDTHGSPAAAIEPVPEGSASTVEDRKLEDRKRWWNMGLKAIADGRLAVLLESHLISKTSCLKLCLVVGLWENDLVALKGACPNCGEEVFAFVASKPFNNSPHKADCHVCGCLLEFRTKVERSIAQPGKRWVYGRIYLIRRRRMKRTKIDLIYIHFG
ncbi:PGR5-like protein 1B, chloroplastic isoform X1, partial [Tanacetum coccineum]